MPSRSPRFIASGNIRPSRFVQPDVTNDFTVLEVDTADTDNLFGISQEGKRRPPGVDGEDNFAAHAGETVHVYGLGEECLLEAGAAVTRGAYLKSDNQGRGVAVTFAETANVRVGAQALESAAAAGVLIRVVIVNFVVRPA